MNGWTTNESLDYTNVSSEPLPPLVNNIYKVLVVEAEPQQTKDGKPAAKLVLEAIETFPDGSEVKGVYSPKLYETVVFTREALFRSKQLSEASGVALPRANGYDAIKEFCDSLLETEPFFARVRQQPPRDGKVFAKVDRYLSATQAQTASEAGATGAADASTTQGGRRKR